MTELIERRNVLYVRIANDIKEHKRSIISVVPTKSKERGFSYTIGNREKQLPELLIIGAWGEQIAHCLNEMSQAMIDREAKFTDGEDFSLGGQYPLRIFDAKDPLAKSEYCIQAGQFYGSEDYEIQQVVLPDTQGRYPADPACHKFFKVPLLRTAIILH